MQIFNFLWYTQTELFRKRFRLFIHQMMCLKRVDKTKTLGRQNKDISLTVENHTFAKWLFNYFEKNTEAGPEMFYKKTVL